MKNSKEKCLNLDGNCIETNVSDGKKNKIQNCPRMMISLNQYDAYSLLLTLSWSP